MQIKMTRQRVLLISLLSVICGLVLPYVALGDYVYWTDEAYQALSVRNYSDAPIGMLAFYIGNLWTRLAGDGLYQLRLLMVICYQISIAASCLFLYRKTGQPLLSSLLFLMLCVAARFVSLPLYGWDAGAYPFMTAFAIGLLWYMGRPGLRRIAAVGALSALMVLSRASTLAALPAILVLIIWGSRDERRRLVTVVKQSAVGLIVFAAVGCGVILLMTGGDFSVYVRAWSPDNIINRHFETGYLIWRLQECSRNVFVAYYPMALCFAGACLVGLMKRSRLAGFWTVSAVCAFLSFNFMRMYLKDDIHPFGLLQSFYILVLVLPWLYNATHDSRLRPEVARMTVVTGCVMLATVGSDGFVERPMVLTGIPLLCALMDKRLYSLLISYTGVALVSVLAMTLYVQRENLKTSTADLGGFGHLAGLSADPELTDILTLTEIAPRIEAIADKGGQYAVVGTERYIYDYIYKDTTSYNLHHFHYLDGEDELGILRELCVAYDYIFLLSGRNKSSASMLKACGFEVECEGCGFTLYHRM